MNKKIAIIIFLLALGMFLFLKQDAISPTDQNVDQIKDVEIIADNLEIPWDIAFLPASGGSDDGKMLITERPGRLSIASQTGELKEIALEGVRHAGEGGLLGVTIHPKFSENHYVYLYFSSGYSKSQTRNRVERYRLENDFLTDKKIIIDNIPGALYHDGGRIEFGPDGLLYITTGDATDSKIAQDKNSLGGKILRLRDDGSIPDGNPFGTAIWSYGHRNPQGIAWDSAGRLWETEHGRSGVLSGLDELNLIRAGENYGWPDIEGDKTKSGMVQPVLHSGADVTWAPASLVYLNGSLFFGGLRGEALYEAVLNGERVEEFKTHFKNEFGRIRTVRIGPDGMLYLTTSNRDGRGDSKEGDDKIIRVNPASLR